MACAMGDGDRAVLTAEFRTAWLALAEEGACDGADGAEYERVLREWLSSEMRGSVSRFICIRANVGADGK